MAKFSIPISIGKRRVDIIADNQLSDAINLAAVKACEELLRSFPFIYIPHLRIKLLSKTDLSFRCVAFLSGLARKYETAAYVNAREVKANHISEMTVYLDLSIAQLIAKHGNELSGGYLNSLNNLDIPQNEREMFVEKLKRDVLHEATHIVQLLKSDFMNFQIEERKRLQSELKKYRLVENEEEKEFLRMVKGRVKNFSQSEERRFVEELFGNLRISIKSFIDLLFYEGVAVYSSSQLKYPFDEKCIGEQYAGLAEVVENKLVKYFKALINMIRMNSEKILGKKEYDLIPKLDYAVITKYRETTKYVLEIFEASVYSIGPHMVYATIFGNEKISVMSLMEMNSYQFINAYEEACSNLGMRPLVSLTSGHGLFDYKRALQELLAAAQYMKKV